MDAHFTPEKLAEELINSCNGNSKINIIADFAVGKGDLLRVAEGKWPKATFIGTDLNSKCISFLKRKKPHWELGKCDFLDLKSRDRCKPLLKFGGKADLILLNPPFSCRGGTRWLVPFAGTKLKCSRAMAFVLVSLFYLNPKKGALLAILPEGALKSQRDSKAWELIKQFWSVVILNENGNNAFKGCSPKTYLIKITPTPIRGNIKKEPPIKSRRIKWVVELIRGSISVCAKENVRNGKKVPFVHSTELNQCHVDLNKRKIYSSEKSFIGPAVLIPRVGKPNCKKTSLHLSRTLISISDCIIALKCKNQATAKILNNLIVKNWKVFEREYNGTGAPYITIAGLQKSLRQIGVDAKWDPPQK